MTPSTLLSVFSTWYWQFIKFIAYYTNHYVITYTVWYIIFLNSKTYCMYRRVIDCVDFYINCSKNHYMFWDKYINLYLYQLQYASFTCFDKYIKLLLYQLQYYLYILTNKSYIQWYIVFFLYYFFIWNIFFVAKGRTKHRWGVETPTPTPCTPIHLSWL